MELSRRRTRSTSTKRTVAPGHPRWAGCRSLMVVNDRLLHRARRKESLGSTVTVPIKIIRRRCGFGGDGRVDLAGGQPPEHGAARRLSANDPFHHQSRRSPTTLGWMTAEAAGSMNAPRRLCRRRTKSSYCKTEHQTFRSQIRRSDVSASRPRALSFRLGRHAPSGVSRRAEKLPILHAAHER